MSDSVKLIFLANSKSPHVHHWIEILAGEASITIVDICRKAESVATAPHVQIVTPLPSWSANLHMVLQYILLGLWMRLYFRDAGHLQVHNASGFGLAGLVSGHNFSLVVYGSEIYGIQKRSLFYKELIGAILRRSTLILVSSSAMIREVKRLKIDADKIIHFSNGVADKFSSNSVPRNGNSLTWVVNRRVHPHYNTRELLIAFLAYLDASDRRGRLIVMEGDSDKGYYKQLRNEFGAQKGVDFIDGFLSQQQLIKILDTADFCISVPDSDQLSSSILEGAARGSIPVLNNLAAYDEIHEIGIYIDEKVSVQSLQEMFVTTAAITDEDMAQASLKCINFIKSKFSIKSVRSIYLTALTKI